MMKRVAVVEDNPDNLLLVEAILGAHYEIVSYENGPDALAALPDLNVSAVLLDISLPLMDGVAVLKAMKEDEKLKTLPVIALTAHAMVGDRERYLAEGFDEYYTKPIVDFDEFIEVIEKVISAAS